MNPVDAGSVTVLSVGLIEEFYIEEIKRQKEIWYSGEIYAGEV